MSTTNNNPTAVEKLDQIKTELGFHPGGTDFFLKHQVYALLSRINPEFDSATTTMDEMLTQGIPGWISQDTVPPHPNLPNIDLIISLLSSTTPQTKTVETVISGDSLDLRQALEDMGYEDPATDTDVRSRTIFLEAKQANLQMSIVQNCNFLSSLAPHTSTCFPFFQSRAGSEDQSKINDFYHRFYKEGEKMKRIPIGVRLSDGKIYIGIGNHRVRAHEQAQKRGESSIGSVLLIGEGLSDEEKIEWGIKMAVISNRETVDSTDDEVAPDLIHQVKSAYAYQTEYKGLSLGTEQQKIDWAKDWLADNKPRLTGERNRSYRGHLANSAFSSNHSQSIPLQDDSVLDQEWKSFWPHDTWKPAVQKRIKQEKACSNITLFMINTIRQWKSRSKFSPVGSKMWLCVRTGSSLKSRTVTISSVQQERKTFLAWMVKEWNNNVNICGAGMPRIEKIMFVQQLQGLPAEAWEWNHQTLQFDKV